MFGRRTYWHHGDVINIPQRVYHTPELQLFLNLSKSFSRLGIDEKIGLRIIWNFYYDQWTKLLSKFDLASYLELIQSVRNKLERHSVVKSHIVNYNSVVGLDTHILFSMDRLTSQENIFCSKICKSYYLNWSFDIHFIRVSRRYNKRYISRVRAVSRPSFWLGNSISCLLVSMFWGASLQGVDWVFVQPIIVDVNVLLVCLYVLIIYKYIMSGVQIRVRLERNWGKVTSNQLVGLLKYYFPKMKWFS